MNELKTSAEAILVHLIRPGFGVRDDRMSEGATLADLLRLSGTLTTDPSILVDGLRPEESLPM
jgi:hypothetical protein